MSGARCEWKIVVEDSLVRRMPRQIIASLLSLAADAVRVTFLSGIFAERYKETCRHVVNL